MMKDWPVWYPGLELKAEHLLGLESYMLSRIAISDETGHGIEEFDWKNSLRATRQSQGLDFQLSGAVKGLTPGGRPVDLRAGECLGTSMDLGNPDTVQFDIFIGIAPDNQGQRATLLAERASPSSAPVLSCRYQDRLYLGRYDYQGEDLLELVHRPLVRCLASMRPLDNAWRRWVDPFSSRIKSLLESLERGNGQGDARNLVVVSEASKLAFGWPTMGLPQLTHQLRYLSWLQSRRHGFTGEGRATAEPEQPFPPDSASGQELPHLLASFLEVELPSRSLPELLYQLQGAIYYHVPLQAFRQWGEHLITLRDSRTIGQVADMLRQRVRLRKLEEWSRVVGLLTMAAIADSQQEPWPGDLLKGYLPDGESSLESSVAAVLHRLYRKEAQEAPAGPLGFCCLAQLAASLPGVARYIPAGLQTYFQREGVPATALDVFDPKLNQNDRVLSHLIARKMPAAKITGVPSPGPRLVQPWMATTVARSRDREIRIAVVGDKESGKTTLLRKYVELVRDAPTAAGNFVPVFRSEASLNTAADGRASLWGEIDLGGTRFNLNLSEGGEELLVRPGGASGGFDSRLSGLPRCDLLILTVEGASVDVKTELTPQKLHGALASLAGVVRQTNPLAMTAIAYTKADEFGVVEPANLRVLEREDQLATLDGLSAAQASRLEDRWKAFLDAAAPARSLSKWNVTREFVLNQTRELWQSIARAVPGNCPAMNGYFVSADPLDDYLRPWDRRGLVQIFNDFFEYYQTVRA